MQRAQKAHRLNACRVQPALAWAPQAKLRRERTGHVEESSVCAHDSQRGVKRVRSRLQEQSPVGSWDSYSWNPTRTPVY